MSLIKRNRDKNRLRTFFLEFFLTVSAWLITGSVFVSAFASSAENGTGGGWMATDTYRIMNFAVLAIALFFLLKKPVSEFLDTRIQSIREQLRELEQKRSAVEAELSEYEKRLATIDTEAQKIIDQYRKQGEAARERILEEARKAAEKLEKQAQKNIVHEFEMVKQSLEAEIFEKALEKAEKKIRAIITAEDQDRLVDEYIKKVVIK